MEAGILILILDTQEVEAEKAGGSSSASRLAAGSTGHVTGQPAAPLPITPATVTLLARASPGCTALPENVGDRL